MPMQHRLITLSLTWLIEAFFGFLKNHNKEVILASGNRSSAFIVIGEFFYRLEHGLLPPVFKEFLPHASDIHTYFTRNSKAYRPVKAHSNTRRFAIKSYGTAVWNALPIDIRFSSTLQVFKKRLRAFLLASI